MSTHIDTLAGWWDSAEEGDPRDGDIIIEWAGDGHAVRTFYESERKELFAACTYRILHRAPKPEPAWHNAVAVIARVDDGSQTPDTSRVALLRDKNETGQWVRGYCDNVYSDELTDVTPLIEAKVTDEMVKRAEDWYTHSSVLNDPVEDVLGILAAALGLDPA